jgi:hypothetical protein
MKKLFSKPCSSALIFVEGGIISLYQSKLQSKLDPTTARIKLFTLCRRRRTPLWRCETRLMAQPNSISGSQFLRSLRQQRRTCQFPGERVRACSIFAYNTSHAHTNKQIAFLYIGADMLPNFARQFASGAYKGKWKN